MQAFTLLLIALVLASCQSSQDRQWADMQTILEQAQPSKNVR